MSNESPLKHLRKAAKEFYQKSRGKKVRPTGTVYICTDGKISFVCDKGYTPNKEEAVFKFTVRTKIDITPCAWSPAENQTIINY